MRKLRGSQPRGRSVLRWCAAGSMLIIGFVTLGWQFARRVLTPAERIESRVKVLAIEPSAAAPTGMQIWLSGPDVNLEGNYSFIFDVQTRSTQHLAGHARLGSVTQRQGSGRKLRIARDIVSVERGELRVGARGRITGWWYTAPEQLGYQSTLVSIPMPGGVGWGWVVTPNDSVPGRWAIHVHGRGTLPHEALRGIDPFAQAGITSLVIAYRNDRGAPPGKNGRYGLGLAEQQDVDAALGWARSQGAERVTLVGWSMGGTAVVLAAANGQNAHLVDAMVLDSPALDWPGILRHQARLAHLPALVAECSVWLLQAGVVRGALTGRRGTDLAVLTPRRLAASIGVPTLIHASEGDTFVPWQGALQVAQLRPSFVQIHPSQGEHVKLWNADTAGWQAETSRFLRGFNN